MPIEHHSHLVVAMVRTAWERDVNMHVTTKQSAVDLKQIRKQVLEQTQIIQNLIPPTVSYTTEGNLLIIGAEDLARSALTKLPSLGRCAILVNETITNQDDAYLERLMMASKDALVFYNNLIDVKGFLGQFQVRVSHDNTNAELSVVAIRKTHFDLILDLSQSPCISLEMQPLGYFYVGHDQASLTAALMELPQLIGEFDKPRYVKVNHQICAHNRLEIEGCRRCLNSCPADAIQSINNKIEIDPYLCHGAGSCTNTCPTGALTYELPTSRALHAYLDKIITRFSGQAPIAPVILFHDLAIGTSLETDALPGEVIPVMLEEIAVAGMEHWMAALACGARQIIIVTTEVSAPLLVQMLEGELQLANDILNVIGHPSRVMMIDQAEIAQLPSIIAAGGDWTRISPADIDFTSKRDTLYAAIDHLNSQASAIDTSLTMNNIPFGQVNVDADSCTLCLSCVAICPTQTLLDGGEIPALHFVEQGCVQCGLCQSACPEQAISLTPRINLDANRRRQRQILKEELPFNCICCGAPFATRSMIERIVATVGDHSAFSANNERLKMCSDCRVKDMFEDILQDPEKQLQ